MTLAKISRYCIVNIKSYRSRQKYLMWYNYLGILFVMVNKTEVRGFMRIASLEVLVKQFKFFSRKETRYVLNPFLHNVSFWSPQGGQTKTIGENGLMRFTSSINRNQMHDTDEDYTKVCANHRPCYNIQAAHFISRSFSAGR